MIIRDDATGLRYEIWRLDDHDYIITEDGHAYPVIAGGDFGATAILITLVVVTILAAAASAYMSYQMGQQQQKAAKYNAKMLERQAELQKQMGQARADDIRQRNRVMLASIEAQTGASGVTMAPGTSPLAVYAYSAREGELDALRAEWTGDANAEATTAESRLMRFKGDVAAYGGTLQAGTTLLSGTASALSTGYSGMRMGGATA